MNDSSMNNTFNEEMIRKDKPTIFPLGFGVSDVENGAVVIIDFFDKTLGREGADLQIIESIAITKNKAKELIKALEDATSSERGE